MKRQLITAIIAVALALPTFSTWADHAQQDGLHVFLGVEGGYKQLDGQGQQSNMKGYHVGGKVIFSYYTDMMVFDIGGGFAHSKVSGDDLVAGQEVNLDSPFAELALRAKFGALQVGPIANAYFHTRADHAVAAPHGSNIAYLVGLSALYDMPMDSLAFRFGLKLMTDVSITNRQGYWALLDLQFGLPLMGHGGDVVEPEPVQVVDTPVVVAPVVNRVSMNFDSNVVKFASNSDKLGSKAKSFLSKFAMVLKNTSNMWSNIEVVGHTDSMGDRNYNVDLSKRRAAAVKNYLVSEGVSSSVVGMDGVGPDSPLVEETNRATRAQNRRVELTLLGVSNADALKSKLGGFIR